MNRWWQIRNKEMGTFSGTNKHTACVDSSVDKNANNQPVKLWPCHNQGGNQVLPSRLCLWELIPLCCMINMLSVSQIGWGRDETYLILYGVPTDLVCQGINMVRENRRILLMVNENGVHCPIWHECCLFLSKKMKIHIQFML